MSMDAKLWAECIGKGVKLKYNGHYFKERNSIALKWMKELGYLLFDEFVSLNRGVRDVLLDSNYKAVLILILALLQDERYF